MLQHEQPELQTQTNAADARVTPEELSAAVKALEEKQSSTVAIGSVVDELRLNATSEQIWDEVQQQRAQDAAAQTPSAQSFAVMPKARPRRRVRWWAIAVVGVVVWGALHNISIQTSPSVTTTSRTTTITSRTMNTTPPPAVIPSGQAITISGDGQSETIPVQGKDVVVTGDGNDLTLHGQARSVTVSGDGNDLSGDAPKASSITGDGNDVQWTSGR